MIIKHDPDANYYDDILMGIKKNRNEQYRKHKDELEKQNSIKISNINQQILQAQQEKAKVKEEAFQRGMLIGAGVVVGSLLIHWGFSSFIKK